MYRGFALLSIGIAVIAAPAHAQSSSQNYPNKPIRVVVPQSAGASTDLIARLVSQKLAERLGQPVIVDNRPGAGSILGTELVSKAAPDGYTLLVVASSLSINPAMRKSLPYDATRDLAPITQLSAFPNMLTVHPSLPVKTVQDLIALAKSKPGQINYGSSGTGTGTHISAELFKYMTGVDMVHIPYKGGAPAVTALLGGQVQLNFATIPSVLPHVKAGKLRAIAVTSAKRTSAVPDVPTIAESGVPGFDHEPWNGMLTSGGTPKWIVAKLNAEVVRIIHSPDVKAVLISDGSEPVGNKPEEFAAIIKSETAKWKKVIKAAGIKAD